MVGAATETSALAVTAAALVTALATGVGAGPLAFARHGARRWLQVGNTAAAAMMLIASTLLFYEGAVKGLQQSLSARSLGSSRSRLRHGGSDAVRDGISTRCAAGMRGTRSSSWR